jgi:hypothetical protein
VSPLSKHKESTRKRNLHEHPRSAVTSSRQNCHEWVSRRCKACTLPHLPSFTAFTIRTWSQRTFRWMASQSMAYHSAASLETAPTVLAVVICFVP